MRKGIGECRAITLTAGADTADTNGAAINGSTYVTTGFKFTTANETVNGSTTTLTGADTLIDGSTADSDTLALSIVGNAAINAMTGTITNIEKITLAAGTGYVDGGTAGTTDVVNLGAITGAKTFVVTGAPTAAATMVLGTAATLGTSGISTVDSTGAGGNLTFTAAYAATKTTNVTMLGGASADVFTGGSGADTISGGAGVDTLVGGAGNDTITGGAGNDNLTGNADRDTFVFEANSTLNGADTFTDLAIGANTDVLSFAKFMSGGAVNQNGGAATSVVAFTAASNQNVNITNKVVTFDVAGAGNASQAAVVAEFAANSAFALDAGGKAIVIVGNYAAASVAGIYMLENGNDSSATVTALDVTLVGTTNALALNTLDTSNFIFA